MAAASVVIVVVAAVAVIADAVVVADVVTVDVAADAVVTVDVAVNAVVAVSVAFAVVVFVVGVNVAVAATPPIQYLETNGNLRFRRILLFFECSLLKIKD